MSLIALDIGTTRCKAGLFGTDGMVRVVADSPTTTHHDEHGSFYDPEELWQTAAGVLTQVIATKSPGTIAGLGIASMAETGLVLDRRTGKPRTRLIPWFDTRAREQAERLRQGADALARFRRTGLHATLKSPLAKLLWLREQDRTVTPDAVWLSAADYVAHRLTGKFATDRTLAARTGAYRIDRDVWDEDWIREWGIEPALFPKVYPSGAVIGRTSEIGLQDCPVAIAGHDHLCAAFGVNAVVPGRIFDSMGTAETLIGTLGRQELGDSDFNTGLLYGRHVAGSCCYWLGSVGASGGSVEWVRSQLSDPPLSYAAFEALLDRARPGPTGIFWFPYLGGSGAPHPNPNARAAFVGLTAAHGRADLAKAVLEGTAFEIEYIRKEAVQGTHQPIEQIVAAGGGTRNRHWMQIKSDVSGCRLDVYPPEAALAGAALLAGVGCGVYASADEALSCAPPAVETFLPDPERHEQYVRLYEQEYERLMHHLQE